MKGVWLFWCASSLLGKSTTYFPKWWFHGDSCGYIQFFRPNLQSWYFMAIPQGNYLPQWFLAYPEIGYTKCLLQGKWNEMNSHLQGGLLPFLSRYMGVSLNGGTPKSSIFIGFSIINHPFWGITIFGNTHITPLFWGYFHPCYPFIFRPLIIGLWTSFYNNKLRPKLSGGVPPLNSQVLSFSTQIYLRNWVCHCMFWGSLVTKNPPVSFIHRIHVWKSYLHEWLICIVNVGVSQNGGTPKTPQNDHF